MPILAISASARPDSANARLLDAMIAISPQQYIYRYTQLDKLPLFTAAADQHPWPEAVLHWRKSVAEADALIICTPEYLHNIPALLKNALEWLTTSGELYQKRVLPITFTPHPPRGEKAMQSLRWSLQALEARVVGELDLYQNELHFAEDGSVVEVEMVELLRGGLGLL
jgi:chromate reductase, NAD(P)H dehydrogenase (quinone)